MPLQSNRGDGVSLPTPNDFPLGTPLHDAYEQCLHLEPISGWNQLVADLSKDFSDTIMKDMPPMTVARVLGYALRHAPHTDGRDFLVREIMSCKLRRQDAYCNPELLAGLAYLYVFGLMRIFYNPKGPTPCISVDQSPRRSFEQAVAVGSHLTETSLVTTSTLRELVLYRDENRCALTGGLDIGAYYRSNPRDRRRPVPTHTAHIISRSFSEGINGMTEAAHKKFNWASTAAAVLERFGGFSAYDILGDDDLNNAANAFTVGSDAHILFNSLFIWLVPAMDSHGNLIPNSYNIQSVDSPVDSPLVDSPFLEGFKQVITFREATMGDIVVQPPSPQLFAMHAACGQVAHFSAAAGHLRDIFGEPDTDCMSAAMAIMTEPESAAILSKKLTALTIISSVA